MEKNPNLKIFVAHGGGYLPAYSARIDHAWGARPDCRGNNLKHKPSDYLKRMYFDTVVFSFDQLKYLIDKYGEAYDKLNIKFIWFSGGNIKLETMK